MNEKHEREFGRSPSTESTEPDVSYQPITVAAAKQFAEAFAKNWVVILAGDEAHNQLHTVTYGRSPAEKIAAASIGEILSAALGADLKQSRFFEDFRAMPAAQARADLEAAVKRIAELEASQPAWISTAERLPEDKQRVLIHMDPATPRLIYGANGERELTFVATFFQGKVPAEGDLTTSFCDQWGNNRVPYGWNEGPMHWFGQDVSHWMPLPKVPA